MKRLNFQPKLRQAGDTIVEVMVSGTVLALVLSMSYISVSRSLDQGTEAANRSQGVAYAQEQVELLRAAAKNGTISTFPANGQPFCINPNGSQGTPGSNGFCTLTGQSPFGVQITYSSGNHTYTITCQWPSRQSFNQALLYYQAG